MLRRRSHSLSAEAQRVEAWRRRELERLDARQGRMGAHQLGRGDRAFLPGDQAHQRRLRPDGFLLQIARRHDQCDVRMRAGLGYHVARNLHSRLRHDRLAAYRHRKGERSLRPSECGVHHLVFLEPDLVGGRHAHLLLHPSEGGGHQVRQRRSAVQRIRPDAGCRLDSGAQRHRHGVHARNSVRDAAPRRGRRRYRRLGIPRQVYCRLRCRPHACGREAERELERLRVGNVRRYA